MEIKNDTQVCGHCGEDTHPSRPYGSSDKSECRVCKYYNYTESLTICENPDDSENCKLTYMDSDGKYICVNECPSGMDKDTDSNLCIPGLKHSRTVVVAVVMLFVSLVSAGLIVMTVVVMCLEKK